MNNQTSQSLWTPEVLDRAQKIANLSQVLQQNTPERKNLEHQLMLQRNNLEQMLALCQLIENFAKDPQQLGVALFASVELKNICEVNYKNWLMTQTPQMTQFLTEIKAKVFELFMRIPQKNVCNLLFECIEAFLGVDYFPSCWPEFLDLTKMALAKGDHQINLKVFKCLEKLTQKYSREERSDPLYLEIIDVVEKIHDLVMQAIQSYLNQLVSGNLEPVLALKCLRYLLQIFYHCIFQDIHPKVEDNITNWVQILKSILSKEVENRVMQTSQNKEDAQVNIFNLKGECVKVILLINSKYKEDFDEHLTSFTEEIWSNCLGHNKINGGKMVTYSIKYFKSCLLYTSPSPRDLSTSRMPSSA